MIVSGWIWAFIVEPWAMIRSWSLIAWVDLFGGFRDRSCAEREKKGGREVDGGSTYIVYLRTHVHIAKPSCS